MVKHGISIGIGFKTFPIFLIVSDSVSKNLVSKSIGFGIGKNLVSKKVPESILKIFGIGKKIRIRFRSDFGYRHTLMCIHVYTCLRTCSIA